MYPACWPNACSSGPSPRCAARTARWSSSISRAFTKLSERLARTGREGAEHLTDTISACFSSLLAEAYADGGSLLKFGGDALLLWFTGEEHALRATGSAASMRSTLRRSAGVRAGASTIVLRMSAGVHSGAFHDLPGGRIPPRVHRGGAGREHGRRAREPRRYRADPAQRAHRRRAAGALPRCALGTRHPARGLFGPGPWLLRDAERRPHPTS